MIITQTPTRLPFGGGATDLPSYYSRFGGCWVSAAINQPIRVIVYPRPLYKTFLIKCGRFEIENIAAIHEIKNTRIRESLKLLQWPDDKPLEIISIAAIPSHTGMGTSSTFTVGLLNALHTLRRENISPVALAEEACEIEINRLGEPIGKQDQYIAAIGGINCFEANKSGYVDVTPLNLDFHTIAELESNLLLFFTGKESPASDALNIQKKATEKEDPEMLNNLHKIKKIGMEIRHVLETGNLHEFGELLDEHWQIKRQRPGTTDNEIDEWYEIAKKNGAVGGKIMGAGGRGFFMFYCEDKAQLRQAMGQLGFPEVRFRFDFEGTKVILNI